MVDKFGYSCTPDTPIRVEDSEISDTKQDQFQPVNSNPSPWLNLSIAWSGDYQSLKNFVKDEAFKPLLMQ